MKAFKTGETGPWLAFNGSGRRTAGFSKETCSSELRNSEKSSNGSEYFKLTSFDEFSENYKAFGTKRFTSY
jgi:hypothetical protein